MLIARWGEFFCWNPLDIRKGGFQFRAGSSGSGNVPWNRARNANRRTSLTGNVISWNLGPLHLSTVLPCIAQTMQEKAAVVLLQEVLIRKGTAVRVRRELRNKFLEYECYIAVGSHVDVGNNKNDRMLIEEYALSKAQITLVIYLRKRFFQANALVRTWQNPHEMSALEHMAQGHVL